MPRSHLAGWNGRHDLARGVVALAAAVAVSAPLAAPPVAAPSSQAPAHAAHAQMAEKEEHPGQGKGHGIRRGR